jgi:hypothetical protein
MLVPLLGLVLVLLGVRQFVGVGDYTGENDKRLSSLPMPPGAERTLSEDSASEGEGGILTFLSHVLGGAAANGWTTRWELQVPAGTTASTILQRYETELVADGWTVSERCCGGGDTIVGFTRGEESVVVNVDNLGASRYEVSVDVHAARTHRKEIGQ